MDTLPGLRAIWGLNQSALATKSGVPQSLISRLETGERELTPATAEKLGRAFEMDPVRLYLSHSYNVIAKAVEEGDSSAPDRALALARKLLTILEEGDLDEAREGEIKTIIQELMKLVNAATGDGRPVLGKPATPLKPAAKASSTDGTNLSTLRRMGGLSRVGGLDEDRWYDKLIEEGIAAPALEQLLDQISMRLSSGLISASERLSLKALQAAAERRVAELAGDGERSSFQELIGDRAAAKSRAIAETQERRDQQECYDELGLDQYGRVIPQAQRDHDRAIKSSNFLSQDEKELGVDRRGLPLTPERLRDRRYVEEGQ